MSDFRTIPTWAESQCRSARGAYPRILTSRSVYVFKPKTELAARHQMQTNGHEKHKETQEVGVTLAHAEICIFSRPFVLLAAILPVVFYYE